MLISLQMDESRIVLKLLSGKSMFDTTQNSNAGPERIFGKRSKALPGKGDVEQPIQAPGTQHGRIDQLRTIGCSDDENISPRLQAIHFRQQLIHLGRRVSGGEKRGKWRRYGQRSGVTL